MYIIYNIYIYIYLCILYTHIYIYIQYKHPFWLLHCGAAPITSRMLPFTEVRLCMGGDRGQSHVSWWQSSSSDVNTGTFTNYLLVLSREWMGLGVAGMIIDS